MPLFKTIRYTYYKLYLLIPMYQTYIHIIALLADTVFMASSGRNSIFTCLCAVETVRNFKILTFHKISNMKFIIFVPPGKLKKQK